MSHFTEVVISSYISKNLQFFLGTSLFIYLFILPSLQGFNILVLPWQSYTAFHSQKSFTRDVRYRHLCAGVIVETCERFVEQRAQTPHISHRPAHRQLNTESWYSTHRNPTVFLINRMTDTRRYNNSSVYAD